MQAATADLLDGIAKRLADPGFEQRNPVSCWIDASPPSTPQPNRTARSPTPLWIPFFHSVAPITSLSACSGRAELAWVSGPFFKLQLAEFNPSAFPVVPTSAKPLVFKINHPVRIFRRLPPSRSQPLTHSRSDHNFLPTYLL